MIDIEPRQLIYNRTGNLSQTTALDQELADQFMHASDLRLDVVIMDSDRKPKQATVSVGSDILAWRSIASLSELSKIVLRPNKFRQVQIENNQYILQIHDQLIDNDIRTKGNPDKEDYEDQYLKTLKTEVKEGLADVLRSEKLGLRTQFSNWIPYALLTSNIPWMVTVYQNPLLAGIIIMGTIAFVIDPLYTLRSNAYMQQRQHFSEFIQEYAASFRLPVPPDINPRDWKYAMMPTIPVDKWYRGRRFLTQHGNDLITARS